MRLLDGKRYRWQLLLPALALAGCSAEVSSRMAEGNGTIVGGTADANRHLSAVSIEVFRSDGSHTNGSGVIIGGNVVATAAHVVTAEHQRVVVRSEHSVTGAGQVVNNNHLVIAVHVHPGFRPGSQYSLPAHDLALLFTDGAPYPPDTIADIVQEPLPAQVYDCGFEIVGYGYDGTGINISRVASNCLLPDGFSSSSAYRSVINPPSSPEVELRIEMLRDGAIRRREFVSPINAFYPPPQSATAFPGGSVCAGDSGGPVYHHATGKVVAIMMGFLQNGDPCAPNAAPQASQLDLTETVDLTRYSKWISATMRGDILEDDPDCIAAQDHTCARDGNPVKSSCGYLAAQQTGWQILHTLPASKLPADPLGAEAHLPPLTQDVINNPGTFVVNQQMDNWHQLHGWRLRCDNSGTQYLANQPGWVRLDGYQSNASFPRSSPVAEGGTWDCQACFMWRGD